VNDSGDDVVDVMDKLDAANEAPGLKKVKPIVHFPQPGWRVGMLA
jgi:hypothetical protein